MKLDLRTPDEQLYEAITRNGERHQLNWVLGDSGLTARLRCLHGTLPGRFRCIAEALHDDPDLLPSGYTGTAKELRDGIIVARWTYEGMEWHYEDEDTSSPMATQRHNLRFVIGPTSIDPVFECLHASETQCHADTWGEDLWAFPEWHSGPDSAARAGTIVSWWAAGQSSDTELPYWAYEEHAAAAIPATLPTNQDPESRSA